MHELAITQEIVSIVCERAGGARVRCIRIEIGKLSCVLPDAVRFCFDLCSEGTTAEGATLEIVETPGKAECGACRETLVMEDPWQLCACGSAELRWLSGQELKIKAVEVS